MSPPHTRWEAGGDPCAWGSPQGCQPGSAPIAPDLGRLRAWWLARGSISTHTPSPDPAGPPQLSPLLALALPTPSQLPINLLIPKYLCCTRDSRRHTHGRKPGWWEVQTQGPLRPRVQGPFLCRRHGHTSHQGWAPGQPPPAPGNEIQGHQLDWPLAASPKCRTA